MTKLYKKSQVALFTGGFFCVCFFSLSAVAFQSPKQASPYGGENNQIFETTIRFMDHEIPASAELKEDGKIYVTPWGLTENATAPMEIEVQGEDEGDKGLVTYRFSEIFTMNERLFGVGFDESHPSAARTLHEFHFQAEAPKSRKVNTLLTMIAAATTVGAAYFLDQALSNGSLWEILTSGCMIEVGAVALVNRLKTLAPGQCVVASLVTDSALMSSGFRFQVDEVVKTDAGIVDDVRFHYKDARGNLNATTLRAEILKQTCGAFLTASWPKAQ